MTRASNTPSTHSWRKWVLKQAKGTRGSKHKLYKTANEQVGHSWMHAYIGRKQRKRFFRRVWISRLNAVLRKYGLRYSQFIHSKKLAQIKLDRKQMSEMAINEPQKFTALIDKVQNPWPNTKNK